jgi:hypothetical protein
MAWGQFDTTFMVIGTGLMFITVFQKRHPTTAPGAVRAFVFFALLILISFLALTDIYVEMYVPRARTLARGCA